LLHHANSTEKAGLLREWWLRVSFCPTVGDLAMGETMERDVAIRLDGMLIGVLGHLDSIAHYMKNNLSEEEYKTSIEAIGRAMSETTGVSASLHTLFPDIVPKELRPDSN
jgi:hypothetical protein